MSGVHVIVSVIPIVISVVVSVMSVPKESRTVEYGLRMSLVPGVGTRSEMRGKRTLRRGLQTRRLSHSHRKRI